VPTNWTKGQGGYFDIQAEITTDFSGISNDDINHQSVNCENLGEDFSVPYLIRLTCIYFLDIFPKIMVVSRLKNRQNLFYILSMVRVKD
jgi:hypothetical protein